MECEPSPQFTVQRPPRRTNAASSPFVEEAYDSPGLRRRADMLIQSHWTLSREKWSSSPDWASGREREWTTFGIVDMKHSNLPRAFPGESGSGKSAANAGQNQSALPPRVTIAGISR